MGRAIQPRATAGIPHPRHCGRAPRAGRRLCIGCGEPGGARLALRLGHAARRPGRRGVELAAARGRAGSLYRAGGGVLYPLVFKRLSGLCLAASGGAPGAGKFQGQHVEGKPGAPHAGCQTSARMAYSCTRFKYWSRHRACGAAELPAIPVPAPAGRRHRGAGGQGRR